MKRERRVDFKPMDKKTLLVGLNLGDYGSTGNMMISTFEYCASHGNYNYLIIVPSATKCNKNVFAFKEKPLNIIEKILFHRILKLPKRRPQGFFEYPYTKRIIKRIKKEAKYYEKIIVHIHNIHKCFIDIRYLFKYLSKETKIKKIFYTLHDSWAFTGGCYTFNYINCKGWSNSVNPCDECHFKDEMLLEKFNTGKVAKLKKKYFKLLRNKIVFIAVSKWMKDNFDNSFLKEYPCVINYGGTSLSPCKKKNTALIKRLQIQNKKTILTVSSHWHYSKGGDLLLPIAERLPDGYVLLVIGGKVDIKHKNLITIGKVDFSILNQYYSIADVFISLSRDESLGLTTCEAQICGVPVIAFDHAAIKETIIDGKTGYILNNNDDVDKIVKAIVKVVENTPFKKEDIVLNGQRFQKNEHAKRMLDLFNVQSINHLKS